jgi:hypothetical protein
MDEATFLHWVVYIGGPALIGFVFKLNARIHALELSLAANKSKLDSVEKAHDQLQTITTEQNYRFEGKLERLSDKVENKVDK